MAVNFRSADGLNETPVSAAAPLPVVVGNQTPYASPDGRSVGVVSNMGVLFSDDFGGAALDATKWDVFDGGLGLNPTLNGLTLTQAAIGTGTTGITHSVASSALSVVMPTTTQAEKWFLSKQVFAGSEDVLILASKTQPIVANSIFFGLVEVDPTTGIPLLNPNLAADFTNRGGIEIGGTVTTTAYTAQAVADSSGNVAAGNVGTAASVLTTVNEFFIEFHAEDIIASTQAIDTTAGKAATPSRVSSQCPNDGKAYKLLLRFKNTAAGASATTVAIQRVLVVDCQEQRVEIISGRGDQIVQKAVPVLIASSPSTIPTSSYGFASLNANGLTSHRLLSAATTNATSVKVAAGKIQTGTLFNFTTTLKYLKIFAKASAPTVGTDTPILVLPIPPAAAAGGVGMLNLVDVLGNYGLNVATGIAYAITGAIADLDTTAVAAGDVLVTLNYV